MADISTGTKLSWASTEVSEVVSINGPGITNDAIDTTNLASTWKAFIASVPDGGEVSMTLNIEPDTTIHGALFAACAAGTEAAVTIEYADGGTTTHGFQAICTAFQITATTADKLTADTTLKVTGAVTLS